MEMKKQVMQGIKKRLHADLDKIHAELNQNRYAINQLAKRQSILKQETREFYKLLRSLPKEV